VDCLLGAMMDPISVASSIAGIASVCLRAATGLNALRSRFKYAHIITIVSLSSQCQAIKAGLSQLEILVRENQTVRSRADLVATFDTTLTGCLVVLSCLESTVGKLHSAEGHSNRSWARKLRNKASIVWNEDEMKGYLLHLHGQQSALSFLIQTLQM
jgi:hypothetical protein